MKLIKLSILILFLLLLAYPANAATVDLVRSTVKYTDNVDQCGILEFVWSTPGLNNEEVRYLIKDIPSEFDVDATTVQITTNMGAFDKVIKSSKIALKSTTALNGNLEVKITITIPSDCPENTYTLKLSEMVGSESDMLNPSSIGITVQKSSTKLSTPTLNDPGTTDTDGDYTVSWSSVSGATSYTLEEDTSSSFSSPAVVYSGAGTSKYITGKSDGTYYYRVKACNAGGCSGWSNVEDIVVSPHTAVLTTIKVLPSAATLYASDTVQFTATAYDQYDDVMSDILITWTSSNETVGTISEKGLFTAIYAGETTVVATNGTVSGTASVTVNPHTSEIVYSELYVTPISGVAPLEITASAKVENIGDADGVYSAAFKINNEIKAWSNGTLNGGENTIVTFGYAFTTAGTYNVTIDALMAIDVMVMPITTPPTVIDVSPTDEATDVPVTTTVSVTFSEAMNEASVEAAFSADGVSGSFTWDGNTMTFTPSANLAFSTTYTVTISKTAKDLAGNNLERKYSWSFITTIEGGDVHGVELSVDTQELTVALGENAAYTLTVKNTGNLVGNFSLSVENVDGAMIASLSKDRIGNLGVGSSEDVLLEVSDSTEGTFVVTVTATSLGGTNVIDTITTTTTVAPELKEITVEPSPITLNIGDTQSFTATANDQDGNAMTGIVFEWTSSNTAVGTVSPASATTGSDGTATTTFTASASGTTTVQAACDDVCGTATVTVQEKAGRIAFVSSRNDINIEIYLMDVDGSNVIQLTNSTALGLKLKPAWSPDGSKIAFSAYSYIDKDVEICVMDADGSNVLQLTNNTAVDAYPVWSPDGSKIAFISDRDGDTEIYVMDADGSNILQLTTNTALEAQDLTWSPKGAKIGFSSNRSGNTEIYVMDADGSNVLQLTDNNAVDFMPAWSPDGTKIAFSSSRSGNGEIYVMDNDGSNVLQLTDNNTEDFMPTWSPDGSKIAFTSDRDGNTEIYVMAADGSNVLQLTNNTAEDFYPDWCCLCVRPTTIEVAPSSKTLYAGNTQQFTATAKDQYGDPVEGITIEWTSSNTAVGTVSQASATTGSDGTATTTFRASSGGTTTVKAACGDVSGTASVTVQTKTEEPSTVKRGGGGGGGGGPSDTDGDGISDLSEKVDGTNRYDPCDPDPDCFACLAKLGLTPTPKPKERSAAMPAATETTTETPAETVTPEPVATPAPKQPGFEAVIAIVGLLAVAYVSVRRKRK